jgi:hypothetical protein
MMRQSINKHYDTPGGLLGHPTNVSSHPKPPVSKDETMEYIQKSKIKTLVKNEGFRLSPESFDGINRAVEGLIKNMLIEVKADGMKTLMNQHTGTPQAKQESNGSCKKCCNIKPEFLRFAKSTQEYCHEQAVILSRKVG